MNEDLKKAIEVLAKKITEASMPDEALKFTQAALNMAHTATLLDNLQRR